ncbi:MAG: hypothetical protein KAT37_02320 [Candidatus Aenigmarchaeota archaeon]|nr:hypothetical protein [Candidatus Aenigmarchaeota archaeon]
MVMRSVHLYEAIPNPEESKRVVELLRQNDIFPFVFPVSDIVYPEINYKGIHIYTGLEGAKELIRDIKKEEEYEVIESFGMFMDNVNN